MTDPAEVREDGDRGMADPAKARGMADPPGMSRNVEAAKTDSSQG